MKMPCCGAVLQFTIHADDDRTDIGALTLKTASADALTFVANRSVLASRLSATIENVHFCFNCGKKRTKPGFHPAWSLVSERKLTKADWRVIFHQKGWAPDELAFLKTLEANKDRGAVVHSDSHLERSRLRNRINYKLKNKFHIPYFAGIKENGTGVVQMYRTAKPDTRPGIRPK